VEIKFIVDNNVGKLAKWLRIMGYDALLFSGDDDGKMVKTALEQIRVILTKDNQIMKRRLVTSGRLKAILIKDDDVKAQLRQVVAALNLDYHHKPFSRCLECNQPLVEKDKERVKSLVPPYVFKTQEDYMECPSCHRLYWRGTHWQAMSHELDEMAKGN
jgi:uncharacterized protein with PIN domain